MSDPLLHRREIWDGRIVHLTLDRVRFPDGREGELEFIRHAGAAAVVPFLDSPSDPDPRIVLLRQYRYAAGGYLFEIPAGMPEGSGEPWEECAHRELEEETGWRAADLRYLTRIYTTPGFTDEEIHLFAAAGLEGGAVHRDSDEYIEVVEMPFSQALDHIRTGEIVDAKTLSALLFLRVFLPGVWDEASSPPPRRESSFP
ncbi:MAG: NUDIX hydrolase [Gemmatimonadales bacterium]|nr:MAG: NUDIX hydrolase [Gemmatimonadales bacterium]